MLAALPAATPTPRLPLLDRFGAGVHPHIGVDDYYQRVLGEANKSALDLIAQSPEHYRYWVDQVEDKESDVFTFGRAYHCALLEPDRFENDWLVLPDFGPLQSSIAREKRRRWCEERADKSFITAAMRETIDGMARRMRRDPTIGPLLEVCQKEVTIVWRDPDTDLPCKARLDVYGEDYGLVLDPKGVLDASREAFARHVFSYRYHVQASHYCEGLKALRRGLRRFAFVAQEKTPPYAIGVYPLNTVAEERGFELRQRDMAKLAECMATDTWPSYNDGKPLDLALPAYAFYD